MTLEQTGPEVEDEPESDSSVFDIPRAPSTPPSLPQIDSVGGIELPSRIGSQASKASKKKGQPPESFVPPVPAIPRKSSRRTSSQDAADRLAAGFPRTRLSTVMASPLGTPQKPTHDGPSTSHTQDAARVPFQNVQAANARNNRYSNGAGSTSSSLMQREGAENQNPVASGYTSRLREDTPSSMGFVNQHRTSDHIHHSPNEDVGRSAEVFGRADDRRR